MNWIWIIVVVVIIFFIVKQMKPVPGVEQITTSELKNKMLQDKKAYYADVREPNEFTSGHIKGMKNVPLSQISKQIGTLSQDKEMVLICQSGNRSVRAANKLKKAGFDKVTNVRGGMIQWGGAVKTGSK